MLHSAISYLGKPTLAFEVGETAHSGRIADTNAKNTIQVPTITLSDLVKKMPKKEELVLVVDIEGAEYEMFKNEPKEIFYKIENVIVEIHPKLFVSSGNSEIDFLKILNEKGFSILRRIENVLLLKCPINR